MKTLATALMCACMVAAGAAAAQDTKKDSIAKDSMMMKNDGTAKKDTMKK